MAQTETNSFNRRTGEPANRRVTKNGKGKEGSQDRREKIRETKHTIHVFVIGNVLKAISVTINFPMLANMHGQTAAHMTIMCGNLLGGGGGWRTFFFSLHPIHCTMGICTRPFSDVFALVALAKTCADRIYLFTQKQHKNEL